MKNKQGLTIAALIIAIVGLSIGFAAFSNTLNISSTASVNPDASALKVVFANNTDVNNLNTDPVQVFSASTGASGVAGTINNEAGNGPTLTGLKANFTQPGQSVVYKLNVVNAGKLKAYLTDIVFGTTGNPAKTVSCTVATKDSNGDDIPTSEQATDSLVQSACNGISISVKIGDLDAKTSSGSLNDLELDVAGYKEVIITISYSEGSSYVDGPMNVAFGDIEINASSVGTQSQGGGEQQDSNRSCFKIETITDDEVTYNAITDYDASCGAIVTIPTTGYITETEYGEFNMAACEAMLEEEEDAEFSCSDFKSIYDSGDSTNEMYSVIVSYFGTASYINTQNQVTIDYIGEYAFRNKGLSSVTISSSIIEIEYGAFQDNSITSLDFSNASSLTYIDRFAFSNNLLSRVTIPSTITTISEGVFKYNKLEEITIPDNITHIDPEAFNYNNLETVSIGNGITRINYNAFANGLVTENGITYGPNNLTSVVINRNQSDVDTESTAFAGFSGTICYADTIDSVCQN